MDIQKILKNEQIGKIISLQEGIPIEKKGYELECVKEFLSSYNLKDYDIILNDSEKVTLENIENDSKNKSIKFVYEIDLNETTKKIKMKQYPLVESA